MNHKINILQFSTTLFMIIFAPFLGIGLYNVLKISKIDTPISIIIAYILSFIFIIIFIKIMNYKQNLDLKEKIKLLFKKPIIVITILSISFFLMACSLFYNINSFIISQFLSETPLIYIAILMGILISYISSKNIEIITRISTILFFLSIILIFTAMIGNYGKIDISNLLPILNNGIKNPISGALYHLSINTIYIFILLIIPKSSIPNTKINKWIILTTTFSFVLALIIAIYTIIILGIDLTLLYHYPAYIIMKELSIFGFIDKIENFIIIHWIFEIFINLSMVTHFIYKMTNIKPYLIITICIITTLFIKNSTVFNYIVTNFIPFISLVILITMLIILCKIKKVETTL